MDSRAVENLAEHGAFGRLLAGLVTFLGLAMPQITGKEVRQPGPETRWRVELKIAPRDKSDQAIELTAFGEGWCDAVEHVAEWALGVVAHTYRRDLADTKYRFFPRRRMDSFIRAGRSTEAEQDETVVVMAELAQALETRAGMTKDELESVVIDKHILYQEISKLKAQVSSLQEEKKSASNQPKRRILKRTARKTVCPPRFRKDRTFEEPLLLNAPPGRADGEGQLVPLEQAADSQEDEEEPQERQLVETEDSEEDTAQSKFTLNFMPSSEWAGPSGTKGISSGGWLLD